MNQQYKHKKTSGRMFLLTIGLFLLTASKGLAQPGCPAGPVTQADIESAAIFTNVFPSIGIGQLTAVNSVLINNGPCDIPTGGATAQVTLSSAYFDVNSVSTPLNFLNTCGGNQWSLVGVITGGGQHNLFFRNNGGPLLVSDGFCGFTFHIRGLNVTPPGSPGDITLVSGLHFTLNGFDPNPLNQFAASTLGVTTFPLPVILSDFSGAPNSCNGVLSWKTATEDNVDRFEIEYSANGAQFNTVGTVSAKNSNAGASYKYVNDQGTSRGYYRLKVIDKNGQFTYSKIVAINTVCNGKKTISLYPNPVTANQNLTVIASGYEGTVKGELVSVSGQVIKTYSLRNGTNTLPIENLAQSTYMLRVTDASGQAESFRVVIIK